jgi:hypothetical protein
VTTLPGLWIPALHAGMTATRRFVSNGMPKTLVAHSHFNRSVMARLTAPEHANGGAIAGSLPQTGKIGSLSGGHVGRVSVA